MAVGVQTATTRIRSLTPMDVSGIGTRGIASTTGMEPAIHTIQGQSTCGRDANVNTSAIVYVPNRGTAFTLGILRDAECQLILRAKRKQPRSKFGVVWTKCRYPDIWRLSLKVLAPLTVWTSMDVRNGEGGEVTIYRGTKEYHGQLMISKPQKPGRTDIMDYPRR